VLIKLRVITRNYEPKLLRVSRNYDVEVHEEHEITHFPIITTKTPTYFNEKFYEFYKYGPPPPQHTHNDPGPASQDAKPRVLPRVHPAFVI
jgi:hypothetical protein